MITAWILYAIAVGSLLGAGGLALEHVLRTNGLSSRWLWAGIILLSVSWPPGHWAWENRPQELAAVALPSRPALAGLPEPPAAVLALESMTVEVSPESLLRLMDGPIMAVWAVATGVLLLIFTSLVFRTHHLRRRWRKGRVGGQAVLFSDEWGPAVVGFIRPQIVLPGWCKEMDDWALRFILDHELEHVRAGDLRLMFLAGIFPILFPWHLPVWWQLARLRSAVEGDCDLRVLGRNPGQIRPYVDLLLEVGERASRRPPMVAMLSEPYETLKRRIRIMTMPLPGRPWVRGVLLAGVGAVLVALACWAPGPTDARNQEAEAPVEAASPGDPGVVREEGMLPVFTPYTVRPDIKNRDVVVRALEREYPPLVRDAGIGGTVHLWFYVDEEGRVQRAQVHESSGHKALDDAALRVAGIIELSPALNRDQRRPVWISLPIAFTTGDAGRLEASEVVSPGNAPGAPAGARGAAPRPEVGRTGEGVVRTPSDFSAPGDRQTGEITGTATEAETGLPIAAVQVFVQGTGRGTLSNQEGRFLIQHVPVGEQEVVALFMGYGRLSQKVAVTTEARAEVTFDLRVAVVPLERLVVHGTAGRSRAP